jgi:hypothetical protein
MLELRSAPMDLDSYAYGGELSKTKLSTLVAVLGFI